MAGQLLPRSPATSARATISKSYTDTETVQCDTTVVYRTRQTGEVGKIVCWTLWGLDEQYSVTNQSGGPFTDANYKLDLPTGINRVTKEAMIKHEFDASGQYLRTTVFMVD